MVLGEITEGTPYRTRLTRRTGEVVAHTKDRGVLVKWDDGKQQYLDPHIKVDVLKILGRAE